MSFLILIPVLLYLLARSPKFQTYVVNQITTRISNKLNTTISIGSIHFSFFNKLVVRDILVLDQNSDTLVYASEAKAGIRRIGWSGKTFHLTKLSVQDPVFQIVTDTTGINNLTWYLSLINSDRENRNPVKTAILINQIEITGGRFALKNLDGDSQNKNAGIDFMDMSLIHLNATIEDFSIRNDTTSMYIYRASFLEQSGFSVKRLSCNLDVAFGFIGFSHLEIITNESLIKAENLSLSYSEPKAFQNFQDDIRLKIQLEQSDLSLSDISFFVPGLKIDPGLLSISGNVSGPLSQLRGRNLIIEGAEMTRLECDFDFSGLPDIENTYLFIDVGNLTTRVSDIVRLGLTSFDKLPEGIDSDAGKITFRGTFSGFTTDFVSYGKLFTDLGSLSTDISFRPGGRNNFQYAGMLQGTDIDAGKISGNTKLLGKVDFLVNVDGLSRSVKDFDATLDGTIQSAYINDYNYQDIKLNGTFTENTWDGTINIRDDNIIMDFIGLLDFQKEIPEFDFSLNIPFANLYKLNIDKKDSISSVSMLATANFSGNKIDNVSGEVRLLNSSVNRGGKSLDIYDGALKTWTETGNRTMEITSDFLNGTIVGEYNFGSLPNAFRRMLADLLPSRFDLPGPQKNEGSNSFKLSAELFDTEKLNDFFNTGLDIADGTSINISIANDSLVKASLLSDHITYKNNTADTLVLHAEMAGSAAMVNVETKAFKLAGRAALKKFGIEVSALTDHIRLSAGWNNSEEVLNKSGISVQAEFSKIDNQKMALLSIDSSEIFVLGNRWTINPAIINFETRKIMISDLLINKEEDYYRVNGIISESKNDTLNLGFEGIELASLNYLSEEAPDDKIRLQLGGTLSGKVLLTGLLDELMIETDDIMVENFRMIGHEYGNVYLKSIWDNNEKVAGISLYSDLDGVRAVDIEGYYNPEIKELNLTALAEQLPIDILNPLLAMFASDISGYASGKINLNGKISEPVITGSLFVTQGTMKVDYLQTQFFFNDTIRFDDTGILFETIDVTDDRGNIVNLNGVIRHKYFNDFAVDLAFNANQAKVLDTRQKDNDMFYGTAFATGVIAIKTIENNLAFDISARTDRNTRFFIPFTSSQSIGDYSFITFTSSDMPLKETDDPTPADKQESEGSISLNFDLDVTPDAEVQLVLDSKAGDVMRGRGSGKLNINLTPKGDFSISGDYIISSGDYLFTLGNIVNKRFSVESGSRISWNGDIEDADIDINAKYRLETSLFDLLQEEQFRERIPVECLLHMTGKLINPIIAFDIYLPTADEQTRSYLKNAINTDEELSRQFIYLLVMNRFYPDPAYRTGGNTLPATGAGSSALGNTMEMVSNQLTNWLSQISNDFDIGFVYRPGNEISAQEVEFALSTQLLNDRVTINGNFDVGANQNNSSASTVTGVFDVEFKLLKNSEKLRLKFFNRSNDNILYETAPYTQGLGIFFRQEFDRFKNIFRRKQSKSPDSPGEDTRK